MHAREPAVAGRFYPADPTELAEAVDRHLSDGRLSANGRPPATVEPNAAAGWASPPKALIAPHAGYMFSGPVAGTAFATLSSSVARGVLRRVVLVGPSHFVRFEGMAVSPASAFTTPLGPVELDTAGVEEALGRRFVHERPDAHAREHCLEVELPFLQRTLDEVRIVPLVTGDASATQVAEVLELLWGSDETLIVISSDLSHYLDGEAAARADASTAEAIIRLQADRLGPADACGVLAIRGLLLAAAAHGLAARLLDLRSSGDTGGPGDRVVGYGAFAFQ